MAKYVVTCCCLPRAPSSSPAKTAASSSSPPNFTTSPKDPPRVGRRDFVLRSSELATLAAIFHFRNYNPKDGRRGKPISKDEAMKELIEVVTKTKPDNFTPRIVEETYDYVRVEYESPIFGFVDDDEFLVPPGKKTNCSVSISVSVRIY
uniref:Uncharacterized protein n=1 Tax=Arundo donax TaxID=35708 RepID=A0A0A9CQ18_ARUDO